MVGVDLGKLRTPAAVAVMEIGDAEPVWDAVRWSWSPGLAGDVAVLRWVEALPLGTAYTEVAARVWRVAIAAGAWEVCFDQTGVGNAVVELLRQSRPTELRCALRGITLTAGRMAEGDHVPRWEILQKLALDFEGGRVKLAAGLPGWPELRRELLALDGAGRKRREPDDRVLALALANWGLTGRALAGERGDGRLF